MNVDPSIKLVRTLKGAPLSILLILKLIGQPATAEFLERTSGYSDKPVNAALQLLEEYGHITRNGRYAWQICEGARQLPLMNLLDEAGTPDSQGQEAIDLLPSETTRKNSESEKFRVLSSSSTLKPEVKDLEVKEPLLERGDDPENLRVRAENLRVSENLAACDAADIHEPKRSKLSKLPHVTAALIRYHTQTAASIPLAIYRIEQNWRIKSGWVDIVPAASVCAQTLAKVEPKLPAETVQVWERAKQALAQHLRTVDYQTWVVPLELVRVDDQGYQVRACNRHGAEWVIQHALALLREELQAEVKIE